jgi:hypothetical protein
LGGAINEAAADHDGEEFKEREEEVDVVKTAAILLDMAAGVVQFNNSSKCHSPTSHDAATHNNQTVHGRRGRKMVRMDERTTEGTNE